MEEEFLDIDKRHAWNAIYQEIRNKSNTYNYTYKDASKVENKNLNRYRDVNPFDHSRVHLQRGEKDYINASFVEVPAAKRSYILTQGPLPATTGHFWLMIWEQKSKAILMLNRIIEKNAVKCHQYWPSGNANGGKDDIMLKDVGLLVTFIAEEEKYNYTMRKFLLVDFQSGKSREVLQFHYTTWPDFGVPESPKSFLNFLFAVRESGALNENVGPPVVHCSAGIGRSGTFCLVDSCLVLIEQKGSAEFLNICDLLLQMRHYRMGLIQTPDQLRFSYMAIIEGSHMLLDNANSYKNVASNIQTKQVEYLNKNEEKLSELICERLNENSLEPTICQNENIHPPPLPPRPVRNQESSFPSPHLVEEMPSLDVQSSHNSVSISKEIKTSDVIGKLPPSNKSCAETDDLKNGKMPSVGAVYKQDGSTDKLRKRKERSEKTAAIVQKIKKKQKESEIWQIRRSVVKRLSVGVVMLIGTGVLVYRYYSKV